MEAVKIVEEISPIEHSKTSESFRFLSSSSLLSHHFFAKSYQDRVTCASRNSTGLKFKYGPLFNDNFPIDDIGAAGDNMEELYVDSDSNDIRFTGESKVIGGMNVKSVEFNKIDVNLLPTVLLIRRPNVSKSALFNCLIRRREALVYNTSNDNVTRDIRDGTAKLGDLQFKELDSAGLEAEASSGSVFGRTAEMTGNVLRRSQFVLFLINARDGLQPMDLDVGKWLRKHSPGINTIVIMNKAESPVDSIGSLDAAVGEGHKLGFGDPIALSAETGLSMTELYEALRPLLEECMLQILNDKVNQDSHSCEDLESKFPLQLAIVRWPNVGKSTLLNAILREDRIWVGPGAGLTRDSVRAQFQYQGRMLNWPRLVFDPGGITWALGLAPNLEDKVVLKEWGMS